MKILKNFLFEYLLLTAFCMVVGLVFLLPACFSKDDIKTYQSHAQQQFFLINAGSKDPCLRLYNMQGHEIGDISGLTTKGNICHFFPQHQKVQIHSLTVVEGIWIQRILALNVQDTAMKKAIVMQISPAEQRLDSVQTYLFFILFFPMLFYIIGKIYLGIQALLTRNAT